MDLSTYSYESYGHEVWQLNSGTSVTHTSNNMPSVFFSGTNDLGSDLTSVTVTVDDVADDDYIGFVFGFNSGDFSNSGANYLSLDWKQGDQRHDFPGGSDQTTAVAGLALSRVTGVPTVDEYWGHMNSDSDAGGGVQELIRATNLGNTGWRRIRLTNLNLSGPRTNCRCLSMGTSRLLSKRRLARAASASMPSRKITQFSLSEVIPPDRHPRTKSLSPQR